MMVCKVAQRGFCFDEGVVDVEREVGGCRLLQWLLGHLPPRLL